MTENPSFTKNDGKMTEFLATMTGFLLTEQK